MTGTARPASIDVRRATLVAAVLGSSVVFLDSTIVNVALVKIGHELPSSLVGTLEGQSYVVGGYLVVLSALLVLAGSISDRYGRRRTFALGMAAFAFFSACCGLAPTLELLILARLGQGVAGALLVPGSLALLTSVFTGRDQGRAIGTWAAATSAATVLGPTVGGFLVDSVSWRAAFLLNVPLVLVGLAAALRIPETSTRASGRFDIPGAIVIALGVGGLSFGAVRGEATDWTGWVPIASLAIGAVCVLAFPFLEARSDHPLVPLGLFRSRNFSATNLATLLVYGALYGSATFQQLFYQGTAGYTALAAGLAGLPVGIALALFSRRVGGLAGRYGSRWFMAAGPAVVALGLLWMARIPPSTAPWTARLDVPASLVPSAGYLVDVLPAVLLSALGMTLVVAPLTTTLMASVPPENAGVASAINNAVSRVGAPLVSAVIFIAISASYWSALQAMTPGVDVSRPDVRAQVAPLNQPAHGAPPQLAGAAHDASTDAFHLAMLAAAALMAGGALTSAIGIRSAGSAGAAGPEEAKGAGG